MAARATLPLALAGVLGVALSGCGADTAPRTRVLQDEEVTSGVHPFSIRYLGHCGGSLRDSVLPAAFRARDGRLHFQGTTDGVDAGLWTSDGTTAGTRLVAASGAYSAGAEAPYVREILPIADGAYFAMDWRAGRPSPRCRRARRRASRSPAGASWRCWRARSSSS
jgi:ELWxxDGT repeat protein